MREKRVSEGECEKRTKEIKEMIKEINEKLDHMKGNCLTTIKNKLNALEIHHEYTKDKLKKIEEILICKKNNKMIMTPENFKLFIKLMTIIMIVFGLIITGKGEEMITGMITWIQ